MMWLKEVCRNVVAVKLAMTMVPITAVLVPYPPGRASLSMVVVRGSGSMLSAHSGNLHSTSTHELDQKSFLNKLS